MGVGGRMVVEGERGGGRYTEERGKRGEGKIKWEDS